MLGIDEGTSAVKAALFDLDGAPLRSARRAKALAHPSPGRVEQDPEAIVSAVVEAVAEVLGAPGEVEVVACGLDHQGESVLAWDAETGRALTPVLTWQDDRSLPPDDDAAVLDATGLPRSPYFSAGKLAWLLLEDPSLARSGVRLGTVDAFLRDRLGAGFATDPSTASRTQLARIDAPALWDTNLAELFGLPIAALPEIRPSVGELGQMRHPQWSQALPLRASVVDQQAALAGAGCVTPGATKATYGTGVFVLAHAGDRPPPDTGGALLPTVAWQRDGEPPAYALDGGVFTAGALMDWLARDLGLAADAAALATLAETVPDAGGVRVLPALAGLGAPHWRPEARAVVAGLSGASRPAHVAHAALDAIAQRVADIVEAMADAGAAPDVLRVDGGLTQSPLLLQRQADLLGLPVQRGAIDATVFGAVALAAVGAGLWPSIDAIADHVRAGERIAPSLDAHARLRERAAWTGFVERAAAL